jgi:hypothetical protein
MVSFATWTTEHLDGQRLHLTSSPGRIFGWSLLIFAVVGAIVAVRPMQWLTEQEDTNPTAARLAGQWWLPVQGAAVAMATAITLGGVAGIVIFFVEADGGRLDVAKSLPILLAYFVNIGIDVFQVAMGAALHASFSGSGGDGGSLSLFDRHGLPAGYFALLVLPPLAIAAGVAWIRRHRATVDPRLLARSCYRMALPAVLIYLALAIPSRVGFEFSGGEDSGTGHAGPQVLLGGLILLAWFVVLGFAAGRYLLQQPPAATAATPPPGRWGRRALTAVPVLAVALAVAVGAGVGGVVTADKKNHAGDFGPLSGLFLFGSFAASSGSETSSGEAQAVPVSPAAPPPTFPSNASSSGADGALRDLANAEESYYLVNGEYTTDEFSLDIAQRSDVDLTLVRADTSSFCAEATDLGSFADYTYDSTVGTVVRGQTC